MSDIGERSDDLNRREDSLGGPAAIIADLVRDAHLQKLLTGATFFTLMLDLVLSVLLVVTTHNINTQQHRQDAQARQITVNTAQLARAQDRITEAAKAKAVFDHAVCVRSGANVAELIRVDQALERYLGEVRPRTAAVTHLIAVYHGVRLTVADCGP